MEDEIKVEVQVGEETAEVSTNGDVEAATEVSTNGDVEAATDVETGSDAGGGVVADAVGAAGAGADCSAEPAGGGGAGGDEPGNGADIAAMVAEAERRGYLRGRNERIEELMAEPGMWEPVEPQPPILSRPRRSIWDD